MLSDKYLVVAYDDLDIELGESRKSFGWRSCESLHPFSTLKTLFRTVGNDRYPSQVIIPAVVDPTCLILPQCYVHPTNDVKYVCFFPVFQRIYTQVSHSGFLAKLANGKVRIEATSWPTFLYDPANADPENLEQGLLTDDLLFHVCHYPCVHLSFLTISRYSTWFSLARAPLSLASSAKTGLLIVMVWGRSPGGMSPTLQCK